VRGVTVSIAPGLGQPRPNRRGEARGLHVYDAEATRSASRPTSGARTRGGSRQCAASRAAAGPSARRTRGRGSPEAPPRRGRREARRGRAGPRWGGSVARA
jgi:hypothetical protein